MKLKELKENSEAVIRDLKGDGRFISRITSIGLTPGGASGCGSCGSCSGCSGCGGGNAACKGCIPQNVSSCMGKLWEVVG